MYFYTTIKQGAEALDEPALEDVVCAKCEDLVDSNGQGRVVHRHTQGTQHRLLCQVAVQVRWREGVRGWVRDVVPVRVGIGDVPVYDAEEIANDVVADGGHVGETVV